MKKMLYLIAMLFIALNFSSCNPETVDESTSPEACCGEDSPITPPPPPGSGG